MSKQNSLFFRSFQNKDTTKIVVLAEYVNMPLIRTSIEIKNYNPVSKTLSLNVGYDGDVFKETLEEVVLPPFRWFIVTLLKKFDPNLKDIVYNDMKYDISFINFASIYLPKDCTKEITSQFLDFFSTDGKIFKKAMYKPMPKNKMFLDNMVLSEYVLKNLGYTMIDVVTKIPSVLETQPVIKTAWDHPVIKLNPNKFRPKVDKDLVDVIKSESKELEYIMNSISKINPAQPNKNFLLIGKPAIGKSETARAIAYLLDLPYAEYTFTKTTEFADSVGKITATMIDQTDKSWAFLPTEVFSVMEAGGIVNFEEVSAMLESHQVEGNNIISGLNRYLYAAGHKVVIHDNTIFFGTTNAGLGGLSKMQSAFLSRWDQIEFTAPSSTVISKFYLKKYNGKLDPVVIKALVELTFGVGKVLSDTEEFLRDDPHWGAAPNVNNRNRSQLIFRILSNPTISVDKIIEAFIRSQIHTNYFSEEVIDKVLVDMQNVISVYENTIKQFYNPETNVSTLGVKYSQSSSPTTSSEFEVEL